MCVLSAEIPAEYLMINKEIQYTEPHAALLSDKKLVTFSYKNYDKHQLANVEVSLTLFIFYPNSITCFNRISLNK